MPLIELDGAGAVQDFLAKHAAGGCVVTFSAHWCGPCKQSKPALEQLAASSDTLAIAYEDALGEEIATYQIRAFPTYVLYKQKSEIKRVEGFNLGALQGLLQECTVAPFLTGSGEALGGGAGGVPVLSPADARAARLAKLGGGGASPASVPSEAPPSAASAPAAKPKKTEPVSSAVEPMAVDDSEDVQKETPMDVDSPSEPVDDPVAKLDATALETLTSAMGFSLIRAQKGLLYGNGGAVEGAVEWLMVHQDDADIDSPIEPKAATLVVAQSYKCNECGKILSNMANLELHANKTGHSDFEESTERVIPLTETEKAAKIAEIKDLLKAKRAEREAAEKEEEKEREKQRRHMGQEMTKTREQYEIEQRKRDAMLRRKEKEDAKRERERIRAELAKDKAERAANKGKLQSKLGVEGYHPDAIQYDVNEGGEHGGGHHTADVHKKKLHASAAKIDEYIAKVSGYKAGGDGGKCLKVLKAYVGNVADHPDEEKYRTIKTDNNAFKTKVKPFIGAKSILLAVGFVPDEAGDALILPADANLALLKTTKAKLEAAIVKYG